MHATSAARRSSPASADSLDDPGDERQRRRGGVARGDPVGDALGTVVEALAADFTGSRATASGRRARASSGSAAQAPPVAGGSGVEGADSGAVSGGGSGAGGGGAPASGVGPPADSPPVAEASGAGSAGDLPRPAEGRPVAGFAGPVFAAARFRGVAVGRAASPVFAAARFRGVAVVPAASPVFAAARFRGVAVVPAAPVARFAGGGGRRARGRTRAGGRLRGRRGRRHRRVCDSALGGPAAAQAPGELDAGAHRLPALRDRRTQEFLRCERHTGTMPGATAADTLASSSGPAPARPARPGRPQAAAGGRSGGSRGSGRASDGSGGRCCPHCIVARGPSEMGLGPQRGAQSPRGWRATNPAVERMSFCQREPVTRWPEVSKRIARHLHEHVARAGPDRHPLAGPGLAPGHERARGERRLEQPGGGEREGDRARAVVARVQPLAVAAAPQVRRARDDVARLDDLADRRRAPPAAAGRCRSAARSRRARRRRRCSGGRGRGRRRAATRARAGREVAGRAAEAGGRLPRTRARALGGRCPAGHGLDDRRRAVRRAAAEAPPAARRRALAATGRAGSPRDPEAAAQPPAATRRRRRRRRR